MEIAKATYSIGDKFRGAVGAKSNFMRFVLISGQMVTVGNGILDIGICLSNTLMDTGFSPHFIQTFWIEKPQNHIDAPMAMIHQHRSVQCRFRSEK